MRRCCSLLRRRAVPLAAAAFALLPLAAGCSGGDGVTPSPSVVAPADPTRSPFAGRWRGTFSSGDGERKGTLRLEITPEGFLTGTLGGDEGDGRPVGTIYNGRVRPDGSFRSLIAYGGYPNSFNGNLTLASGRLRAEYAQTANNITTPGSFDLAPGT